MRRAHGSEAAMFAARASDLAGFDGTSTVLAKPMIRRWTLSVHFETTVLNTAYGRRPDSAAAFANAASRTLQCAASRAITASDLLPKTVSISPFR
jgi:hypothetical protein